MSWIGRLVGALACPLCLWAADAEAQIRPATRTPPLRLFQATRPDPVEFRSPRDEFAPFAGPQATGLTATVPLAPNVHFAIGRFSVPNFRAPRMEAAEIRRGNRNIAAVGLSLKF